MFRRRKDAPVEAAGRDEAEKQDVLWGEEYPWIRVLYFDHRFRRLAIAAVLIGIAGLILLPKMWSSTAPGESTVVRISLLEKIQSYWALRQFEAAARESRWETAIVWINRAHSYNPGSPIPSEKGLAWFAQHPAKQAIAERWLASEAWLIQKNTGTNQDAIQRVAAAFAVFENDPLAIDTLYPLLPRLGPPARLRLFRAAIFQGRADLLDEILAAGMETNTPEGQLCLRIYQAGSAASAPNPALVGYVRTNYPNFPSQEIAARYLMASGLVTDDTDACAGALEALRDLHAATVNDEYQYWTHLVHTGRREQALDLARKRLELGCNIEEADSLVRSATSLGLIDETLAFLEHALSLDPQNVNLRLLQAGILLSSQRWRDLSESAIKLRNSVIRDSTRNLGHLLEATASAEQGLMAAAQQSLSHLNPRGLKPPYLVINCAQRLSEKGLAKESLALLETNKDSYLTLTLYWTALQSAAFLAGDSRALLANATQAHNRWPDDDSFATAYATTLVMTHTEPATALAVVGDLLKKTPDSEPLRLTKARALVQTKKWSEAAITLADLEDGTRQNRTPEFEALLQLTRFEYLVGSGDVGRAADLAERIHVDPLPQFLRDWFATARQAIDQTRAGLAKPVK